MFESGSCDSPLVFTHCSGPGKWKIDARKEAWSQWGKIWAKDEQIKGRIKMINTSIINHTYKQYYQVTRKEMLFGSFHLILYEHSDELSDWNIITNSLNS